MTAMELKVTWEISSETQHVMESLKFYIGAKFCLWGLNYAYPQKDVAKLIGSEPLVYVNPREVQYYVPRTAKYKPLRQSHFLVGGQWDKNLPAYSSHYVYRVMADLIDEPNNDNFSATKAFQQVQTLIEQKRFVSHRRTALNSKEKITTYLRRFLSIRDDMLKNGYRAKPDPKDKEIGLAICRDGRLVHFSHGKHRLALAQLLGLDKIVAKIRIVHPLWYFSCASNLNMSVRENLLFALERTSSGDLLKED